MTARHTTWKRAPLPTNAGLGSSREHYLPHDHAIRLFHSVRFFNRVYGLMFNVHATFQYGALGIDDPKAASKLLSDFNQAAGRWVRRQAKRCAQPGWVYGYVYVHEHARDRGLHTHLLLWAPPSGRLHKDFEIWSQAWLRKRFGVAYHTEALFMRLRRGATQDERLERQWRWVAYLLKSVEEWWRPDPERGYVSILEMLGIGPAVRQPSWPVDCAQRSGVSQNIANAAFSRRPSWCFRARSMRYSRAWT